MTEIIHLEAIWRIKIDKLFKDIDKHTNNYLKNLGYNCIDDLNKNQMNKLEKERKRLFGKRINDNFKLSNKIGFEKLKSIGVTIPLIETNNKD